MFWDKHEPSLPTLHARMGSAWHTAKIEELYRINGRVKVKMQRYALRNGETEFRPKTTWLTEEQLKQEKNNIRKVVKE